MLPRTEAIQVQDVLGAGSHACECYWRGVGLTESGPGPTAGAGPTEAAASVGGSICMGSRALWECKAADCTAVETTTGVARPPR